MWCEICGKELPEGSLFCLNCGTKIETEIPVTQIKTTVIEETVEASAIDEQTSAPESAPELDCAPIAEPVQTSAPEIKAAEIKTNGTQTQESPEQDFRCPKCGKKCDISSTFCPSCGFRLKGFGSHSSSSQNALQNVVSFLKEYFHSPADATKKLIAENDWTLAAILFIAFTISVGLQLFMGMKYGIEAITHLIGSLIGSYMWSITFKAPLVMSIIYSFAVTGIAILIYTLAYFLVAKFMGKDVYFLDAVIACTANTIFPTAVLLVSALLFAVSSKIGLLVAIMAQLSWIIMGVISVTAFAGKLVEAKAWICYILAVCLSCAISISLAVRIDMSAAKQITMTSDGESITIGEVFSQEGINSVEDFLSELLEELIWG